MDGDADIGADDENGALVVLGAEVASLRARLAEKDRQTSEFVARLAHELRTPLGAILMWAHVLRLGRDADRGAAIDAIETSARAESKIIARLLDVSRALVGRLKINRAILDLREPVRAALEDHRSDAHAHKVKIEIALGDESLSIVGDRDRLREIVSNLVSNGIKFNPPGGIVKVRLSRVGQHARLTVTDTGFGFERQDLPDIFNAFQGAGEGEIRAGAGLGLGLALARLLTELHEGAIRADSDGKGRGTVFTIDLPLTAP